MNCCSFVLWYYSYITVSQHEVCNDIANAAAGDDTDKTGNHEAVVQDELSYTRCTGAVKADAGKIRRVGRQEEITVAGRNKREDKHRVKTDIQRHRNDDSNRRPLRVDEL